MNEKRNLQLLNIVSIYIILQPIFDILSFLNVEGIFPVPFSTLIKPCIIFGILGYIILKDSVTRKKWWPYLTLYGLYILIHFIVLYNLGLSLNTIFHEIRYLLNIAYMISIFIIFWYLHNAFKNNSILYIKMKTFLVISIVIYLVTYLLAYITGTSDLTYKYADSRAVGYKGWLASGQVFGHILSTIYGIFTITILKSKQKNVLKMVLLFLLNFTMFMIGTKVSFYMVILVNLCLFIAWIITKLFKVDNKLKWYYTLLFPTIVLLMLGLYKYSPTYKNTQLNINSLNKDISEYTLEDDIDGISNVAFWKSLNTKESLKYSNWAFDSSMHLRQMYNEKKVHPANIRGRQLVYSKYLFSIADVKYKLFGIGYINNSNQFSLESDLLASFYCFGIVGFVIIAGLIILEYIKLVLTIIKNIKTIDLEIYSLFIGISAFFFISVFAGYTFFHTSFSFFLMLLIWLLKVKIRNWSDINEK